MSTIEIGTRIRELRRERAISLSELARRAGIGKGSLSEIEAGGRNPTIETLYSLCEPLDVPLTALVGETPGTDNAATGGMRTVLLSVRHLPTVTVEVFRLEFPGETNHISPAHGRSVREHLTVVAGTVEAGRVGSEVIVQQGDSVSWTSDGPHRFATTAPAEAVVVIMTPLDS